MNKQLLLGSLVFALAAGCASGRNSSPGPGPGHDGGADLSGSVSDGGPPDLLPLGRFGDPCTDRSQCASAICVFTGTGGVCSKLCDGSPCPMGYGCYGVLGGSIDPGAVVDICVPENNRLCSACTRDSDCANGVSRDLCVASPSGATFCARDCTRIGCPNGYQCKTLTVGDMGVSQCIPRSGSCDCDVINTGITRSCTITTPYSVCTTPRLTCNGASGWSACTPPSTTDRPDDNFVDANCDGIDGDIAKAIFVDVVSGNDGNPGTILLPVKSIGKGIALATAQSKDVYVSKGTYNESVTLAAGVSLYGGYDASASWQRANANTTTINGGSTAVDGANLNMETHVELFSIVAANASGVGQSSYGVHIYNSTGPVYVRTSDIRAGNGSNGTTGSAGGNGSSGATGGSGGNGCQQSCSFPTGGSPGGGCGLASGGVGGAPIGSSNGGPGATGLNGSGLPTGGSGGAGGQNCNKSCISTCNCGNRTLPIGGGTGRSGADGTNGIVGPDFGAITGGLYVASSGGAGASGVDGWGGGGGGAGGSSDCPCLCNCYLGGAGGGGGGGGCHGTLGTGGTAGGGSFTVFAASSTLHVEKCNLTSANGGDGVDGAAGGVGGGGGGGGSGGGGSGGLDGEPGAPGGPGGSGGSGGSGAGGNGGPSFCIYVRSTTLNEVSNNKNVGSGGNPGNGGSNGVSAPAPPGHFGRANGVHTE